jgi:hypothetical protein
VLGGDGLAVPFHERGVHLDDAIAVLADQLGAEGRAAGFGQVVFLVAPDVHLADDVAADQQRDRAVDGGPGNRAVDRPGALEEVLRRVMALSGARRLEDRHALAGRPEAFLGDEGLEGAGLFRGWLGGGLRHADLRHF